MIWHHDKRVEFVFPFATIVLKRFEEELASCRHLEDAAGIVGSASDEERAGTSGSGGDRHVRILERQWANLAGEGG